MSAPLSLGIDIGGTFTDVVIHDPCYLGRVNDESAAPRSLISDGQVEPEFHSAKTRCCGAGGGRMWMEEHLGKRINVTRTEQALETGATTVATACPFCITMINDGMKEKDMVGKVKVKDISELIDETT